MAELLKVEKLEPNDGGLKTARNSAQNEATVLAKYVGVSLGSMETWSFSEKHLWLKCMLLRHLESERVSGLHFELSAIDFDMHSRPDVNLDDIVQIVETRLGYEIAAKLRGDLAMWRNAAAIESRRHRKSRQRSGSGGSDGGSGGSGDLLWQHILRMLMTNDPAVRWQQPAQLGYFQFIRSSAAAKSWGRTKNNENMSFEKMSRSIRQYYRQNSGVIQKVASKARLQYKFNMSHPDVVRFLLENFPQCHGSSTKGMQEQ